MALRITPELVTLLPELERRVYDPLIERKLHLTPAEGSEHQAYLRKRMAMGRFCVEATELAEAALEELGVSGVEAEHHARVSGDEDLHHHFLVIPSVTDITRDTVIDFTYLQFTRNWNMAIAEARPNIFLGSRADILELMADSSFAEPNAGSLYEHRTLVKP